MLKIGLLGVGHLGKIHLKCLSLLSEIYEIVGFYDPDDTAAAIVEKQYAVKRFLSVEKLLEQVEVVDIVTPTMTHFEMAKLAMLAKKHVFIEKPLTHTSAEAAQLIALAEAKQIKVQVGHVERFNPALLALEDIEMSPMFIEAHRLATFNPRGTDVSVVLDLMIHDLDIVLSLVPSPVKFIQANGVAVVSNSPDICNARIEFENGCVANLTASRISMKQMRKVRLFQKDAYISLDFLGKKAEVIRLYDKYANSLPSNIQLLELNTPTGEKLIHLHQPPIEPVNAIKMELETFATSILNNSKPIVSIEDGYRALKIAEEIIAKIEKNN